MWEAHKGTSIRDATPMVVTGGTKWFKDAKRGEPLFKRIRGSASHEGWPNFRIFRMMYELMKCSSGITIRESVKSNFGMLYQRASGRNQFNSS